MASFLDEAGKVMIEEFAAQRDVKRLRDASARVGASIDAIRRMDYNTAQFQGRTADAIAGKNAELLKRLNALKNKLDATANDIEKTVKYYKKLDAMLKAAVLTSSPALGSAAIAARAVLKNKKK